MGNLFEYLSWRGDLPLTTVPITPVDALIFSALSYLNFAGIVPGDLRNPIPLHVAADAFLSLADAPERVRVKSDLQLLRAAADAPRLRNTRLALYRSKLIEDFYWRTALFFWPSGARTTPWWAGRKIST